MTPAAVLSVVVRANTAQANSALTRTHGLMKGMAADSGFFSERVARGFKLMTIGAVGFAGATGVMAIDFDKAMRNVNTLAKLPEPQFKKLSESVLGLAGKTAQAPVTLAEGVYELVSSGFDAAEALHIVEKSAIAASAGLTTTEVSTKAVAAVLNAYRLPASKAQAVSDDLFQTVNLGVIRFDELASTIGDVLPFSSTLAVNLKAVGAATATMTKAGLSPPETMTRIKNTMVALIKPSEALEAVYKDLGVATGKELIEKQGGARVGFQRSLEMIANTTLGTKELEAAYKSLGVNGMDQLEKKEGNMSLATAALAIELSNQGAEIAQLFPNIRSLGGVLALTGANTARAEEDMKGFADTAGVTSEVFKEQQKSAALQIQQAWTEMQANFIRMGAVFAPIMADMVKGTSAFVDAFESLPGPVKTGVVVLGLMAYPLFKIIVLARQAAIALGLLTVASTGAGAAGAGGAAAGAAGGAGLLDILKKAGPKALGFGTIAGAVFIDGLITEVSKRSKESSSDIMEMIAGKAQRQGEVFGLGIEDVFGESDATKHFSALKVAIDAVTEAGEVTGGQFRWIHKLGVDAGLSGEELARLREALHKINSADFKKVREGLAGLNKDLKSQNDTIRQGAINTSRVLMDRLGGSFKETSLKSRTMAKMLRSDFKDVRQAGIKETRQMASQMGIHWKQLRSMLLGESDAIRLVVFNALSALGVSPEAIRTEIARRSGAGYTGADGSQGLKHGGLAGVVPGVGAGDKHMLALNGVPIARVESKEGIFVGNRSLMGALDLANSVVPRKAEGGPVVGSVHGGAGGAKMVTQASMDSMVLAGNMAFNALKKLAGPAANWSSIDKLAQELGLARGTLTGRIGQAGSRHGIMGPGGRAMATDYSGPVFGSTRGPMAEFTRNLIPLALKGALNELFYDPLGGWDRGSSIGAIGNHDDHVHVALALGGLLKMAKGGGVAPVRGQRWADILGAGSPLGSRVSVDEAATVLWQTGKLSAGTAGSLSRYVPGESGGRHNAVGPSTSSGRARGFLQLMLPLHQARLEKYGSSSIYDIGAYSNAIADVFKEQSFSAWEASPTGRAGDILRGMTISPWEALKQQGPWKKQAHARDYLMKLGLSKSAAIAAAANWMSKHPKQGGYKPGKKPKGPKPGQAPAQIVETVASLTRLADEYAQNADMAEQIEGVVRGKDAVGWLKSELEVVWKLRNKLIQTMEAQMAKVAGLSAQLATANEAVARARKAMKNSKGAARDTASKRLDRAIRNRDTVAGKLEKVQGNLSETKSSLDDIQGLGSSMKYVAVLSDTPGEYGGRIFDIQQAIREAGQNAGASDDSGGLTPDMLKELYYLSTLGVQFQTGAFAGLFAKGGKIGAGMWGIAGETGHPEIIHGPATVTPAVAATGGGHVDITFHDNRTTVVTKDEVIEIIHGREAKIERTSRAGRAP